MKRDQLSTAIDPDLRKAFNIARARRDVKLKDAVEDAIRIWIEHGSTEKGNAAVTNPGDASTRYQAISGDTTRNVTVPRQNRDVEYPADGSALTALENLCIDRLLRILRSPNPGLPDAIISNLVQFDAFREMYERTAQGDADSTSRHQAGEPEGIGERDRAVADAAANARRLRERMDGIVADGRDAERRKTGTTRTPRKRSGT